MTTSLMALVAGATVSALAGGIRVWERSVEFGSHHQAALIAFTKLEHDLRNARPFAPVPFEGAYDQCTLAIVDRPSVPPNALPELGRLGYYLNERDHVLCRSFVPYPMAPRLRLKDRCQPVLEDVAKLRLRYFGHDEEGGAIDWSSHWRATHPPLAVQVELTLQAGGTRASTHAAVIYVADPPPPEPHDANHQ